MGKLNMKQNHRDAKYFRNISTRNMYFSLVFKYHQKEAIQKANDQAYAEGKKQVRHKIHSQHEGSRNMKFFSSHMGIFKTRHGCSKT